MTDVKAYCPLQTADFKNPIINISLMNKWLKAQQVGGGSAQGVESGSQFAVAVINNEMFHLLLFYVERGKVTGIMERNKLTL